METLSALLGLYEGNPLITAGFPLNRLVMRMFSLMLAQTSCWPNSQFANDLKRHGAHVTLL